VGVAKPARHIFELTCERLGVRPEEIIFLDDVEKHAQSARSLRMHAILFQSNEQAIAAIEEEQANQPFPRSI
jgi:putative hydrolase of the HAD superfamily